MCYTVVSLATNEHPHFPAPPIPACCSGISCHLGWQSNKCAVKSHVCRRRENPSPSMQKKTDDSKTSQSPTEILLKDCHFFFLQYKLSTKTRPSPEPKASPRPPALKQTCALKNHKKEGHPNILDIVIFQDSNKSGYLCTIY